MPLGFSQTCENEVPMRVAAQSGVKMRSGAGVNNAVVVFIPRDSVVDMCTAPGTVASFEGVTGQWRKVAYKGKSGFLFDGFLAPSNLLTPAAAAAVAAGAAVSGTSAGAIEVVEDDKGNIQTKNSAETPSANEPIRTKEPAKTILKYNLLTEVYNYCGSIATIDPGLVWYALFQENGFSYLKRREIQVIKSKYPLSENLEFDIRIEKSEQPSVFMIGFETAQKIDTLRPIVYHEPSGCDLPKAMYPGMRMVVYGQLPEANLRNQVTLSATGNVTAVGICPEMQNYRLRITGEKEGQPVDQDLNPLLRDMGKCGIPDLRWFGDVNNDGYPELLFVVERLEHYQFILLTSDTTDAEKIYRRSAVWTNYNCD